MTRRGYDSYSFYSLSLIKLKNDQNSKFWIANFKLHGTNANFINFFRCMMNTN